MIVLTAETCWALNEYWINNKISGIKLVFLFTQLYYLLLLLFPFSRHSNWTFSIIWLNTSRSQWPCGLRRRSAAARLLTLWVRIPSRALMSVCCECCVSSGRGLCDELITRPEESYRLWCVVVCDLETSWMRRLWSTGGCRTIKKIKIQYSKPIKVASLPSGKKIRAITYSVWPIILDWSLSVVLLILISAIWRSAQKTTVSIFIFWGRRQQSVQGNGFRILYLLKSDNG